LVNHPTYTVGATIKDFARLIELDVHIEHSICMFIDSRFKTFTPEQLKNYIDAAGVDRTFFGSDLGQADNPSPVEGFRRIIRLLLELGYGEEDIRKMVGLNAMRLAGLGANEAPALAKSA
jgi:predicted TIM-barrel fold metal-dependent hydrolase